MTKTQRAALTDIATGRDSKLSTRTARTVDTLIEAGAIRAVVLDDGDWTFVLTEEGANLIAGGKA